MSSMRQASFKCETPRLKLKSSRTILAIKRCERTKIGKVIKQSRSSKLRWAHDICAHSRIPVKGVHRQTQIHKNITCEMYSCICLHRCTKMDVQTIAVSAIFEFCGNKFELGEIKFERERETIIFSYDKYFGRVIIFWKNIIFE